MNELFFDFYGQKVCIKSDWQRILGYLKKDFAQFISKVENDVFLRIEILKEDPKKIRIPKETPDFKTRNSLTYEVDKIRYNDYFGKLLTIFDYKNESAIIYSLDEHKTHEIAYLLILSRIGKKLDLEGICKIHAFAISYKNKALICMMPMGGGKSTLLIELLKNPDVKMISDDIPLVNFNSEVLSFPIKVGTDEKGVISLNPIQPDENVYVLFREHYGKKIFVSTDGIENKVEPAGKKFQEIYLLEGKRVSVNNSNISSASMLKTLKGLFYHAIIGIGLPMILEYFWEFGLRDFFMKTKIFFIRCAVFTKLCFKSKKSFGARHGCSYAAKLILSLLEEK